MLYGDGGGDRNDGERDGDGYNWYVCLENQFKPHTHLRVSYWWACLSAVEIMHISVSTLLFQSIFL